MLNNSMQLTYYKIYSEEFLEQTLCSIACKGYNSRYNINIVTNNEELTNKLDKILWTHSKKAFIPHATENDPYPELQPILLSKNINYANHPQLIIFIRTGIQPLISIKPNDDVNKIILIDTISDKIVSSQITSTLYQNITIHIQMDTKKWYTKE